MSGTRGAVLAACAVGAALGWLGREVPLHIADLFIPDAQECTSGVLSCMFDAVPGVFGALLVALAVTALMLAASIIVAVFAWRRWSGRPQWAGAGLGVALAVSGLAWLIGPAIGSLGPS